MSTNQLPGNRQPFANLIGSVDNVHVCFTNDDPQSFFLIQASPQQFPLLQTDMVVGLRNSRSC